MQCLKPLDGPCGRRTHEQYEGVFGSEMAIDLGVQRKNGGSGFRHRMKGKESLFPL